MVATSPDVDLVAMHAEIRAAVMGRMPPGSTAVFRGGAAAFRHDTDHEHLFRQESHFHYLFGVNEPGLYGVLHESTRTATLLVPRHGVEYEIWCGKLPSQSMYKERYGVDKVMFVDELSAYLSDLGVKKIQVLQGVNSDSGTAISPMAFDGIERFEVDGSVLLEILTEARLIKTAKELAVMQYVNDISSKAHVHVMQNCRPGLHEFQLEAMFVHFTEFYGGCRYQSYTCICGSGPNGAVLHYGHAGAPNDAPVKDGGMCLLDMGAEWHCYASDITCSFPANGKFSPEQRVIYEIVLEAQRAVESVARPGVEWADMHSLALRVIGTGLLRHRFLVNATVDEAMALHLPDLFMPHGLGHLMGPSLSRLRMNRPLQAGMVVTNEPGLYFIEALLLPALNDPKLSTFLNRDKIMDHLTFGGIRLEDDLVITENGCRNLTRVPRSVEDIERVMAGADFPCI
ncbi:unnamed protein product (mitochondrion) [Plasmodiophora brassicae]|uniref:Xaa-Pro dipeptidase n=1 Tax=Plasmodiophora brassicae TaxID=37360 RepID=A0A3P3YC54_PLABS|nr:unnamed protein product [Plasmodiophora brassicae]